MNGCFESFSALSAPNSVRRNSLLSCAIPPSPAFSVLTALGDYCNFVSKLSLLVRLCSTLDMWLTLNRFKLFSNPSLEEIANNTTNCLHNIREIVQILEVVCIHNNIFCGNISSWNVFHLKLSQLGRAQVEFARYCNWLTIGQAPSGFESDIKFA